MKRFAVSSLVLGLLLSLPATATTLYKWVDENGRVYYSDRVPPEAAAREREIKSKQGLTVEVQEAAKTREEIEAERRQQEAEQARQEAEAKQREQDRILLMTFSKVGDLERARDDRISAVTSRITLAESLLGKLNAQIEQLQKRAADAERSGRGNPEETHRQIADLRRQIVEQKEFIESRAEERDAIATRFEADIGRFKALTAAKRTEAAN